MTGKRTAPKQTKSPKKVKKNPASEAPANANAENKVGQSSEEINVDVENAASSSTTPASGTANSGVNSSQASTSETSLYSAIWAGYRDVKKLQDGKRVARCKICRKIVTVTEGTSNAWAHYRHKHKLEYAKYAKDVKKHSSVTKFTVTATPLQSTSEGDVLESMALLVTAQNLSPEVAASPEMLELLRQTRNLAPHISSLHLSADTLRTTISKLFKEYFGKLQETVKAIDSRISFTTDGWSSSTKRPFLGINAQWIDRNFSLQSVTFDFVEIHGGHSGANIAQTFFESVQKLGAHQKVSKFCIYL
jgi:hypothetical protein